MTQTLDKDMEPNVIDVTHVEEMGKDVLGAFQSLRELLDARAVSLEACRKALEEQYSQLGREREDFAQQQNELCDQVERQKGELEERETLCRELEVKHQGISTEVETLKEQQKLLAQHQESLEEEKRELAGEKEELGRRETDLSKMATTLELRREDLDQQESQILLFKKEWECRINELNATRDGLSGLQSELNQELKKVASDKPDVLADPVLSQNSHVKSSLERFQKLCRDAKRRAIGAEGK